MWACHVNPRERASPALTYRVPALRYVLAVSRTLPVCGVAPAFATYAITDRSVPLGRDTGSLKTYGVGQSVWKSFAKSMTSVPPLGLRAETSIDLTSDVVSNRRARTCVSVVSRVT